MKKIFLFLISVTMWIAAFQTTTLPSYAKSGSETMERAANETMVYFEDGSYMTITLKEEIAANPRASYDRKASKDVILHNSSGKELWRFTVYGSFSVNPGISAACTAASYSVSISDSAWQNESASASYTGNQAIGDAAFIRKLLGITVESKSCHVVLTCDSDGNFS